MPFRIDRLLTLYLFGPLSRLRKPKGLRVPILMYHSISDEPEKGHPYYWINTSPARFAEQMKFLHDNNYRVISLSDAVDLIREQGSPSGSPDRSSHHSNLPSFQSSGVATPSADSQLSTRNSHPASSFHNSTIPPFHHSSSQSAGISSSHHSNLPSFQSSGSDRYVVLTFDDGYRDFYTHAFPVFGNMGSLRRFSYPLRTLMESGRV